MCVRAIMRCVNQFESSQACGILPKECDIHCINVFSLCPSQSGNAYSTETPRGLRDEEKLKWSYVHGLASTPLIGVTIGQRLRDMAEAHPGREAMVFCRHNVRFTFEQLLTQVTTGLV